MTRTLSRAVLPVACCLFGGIVWAWLAESFPSAAPVHSAEPADAKRTVQLNLGRIIDLTHSFDESTIYWPTEKGFELDRGEPGYTDKGYYYAAYRFRAAEHGGTHLDAPIHFFEDRKTADEVPLGRLVAPGVVVDVSRQCARNPDYQISVADLRAWEEEHRRTLTDVILLLKTGYADRWPDRKAYLGTAGFGPAAVRQLHFPGLHPDAARWLVDHRAVLAVGIDTASIDHGQSTHFASHVTLFEHNVPVFENVALKPELPPNFLVAALPMKIGGGTGGPLRIVAIEMP